MTGFLITLTKWFIPAMAFVIIFWDVIVYFKGGPEATISRVFQSWAAAHQVIPFALGVLSSHLFWPTPLLSLPIWWVPLTILAAMCIFIVVFNHFGYHIPMSAALLLGLAVGRIVWPQSYPY